MLVCVAMSDDVEPVTSRITTRIRASAQVPETRSAVVSANELVANGAGRGQQLRAHPGGERPNDTGRELVVLVQVPDLRDDPGWRCGQCFMGEGGEPGSAGLVDRAGQVAVKGSCRALPAAQLVS